MELPKNVTQIGEVNKDCKIYVEDYVVSYMKQLNQSAQDKEITMALYGKRQGEEGVSYYFLYGACRTESLQREVRHLSQAQLQEIEKLRKKHFKGLEFVGYRILNGDMIEGMHICEQGICRYIGGYARFYEKNDDMLAYMLAAREQAEPEYVDQTKYEEVKKRQEERKGTTNSHDSDEGQPVEWLKRSAPASANLQKMRLAAVGAFALLCLLGIGTFRENELKGNKQASDMEIAVSALPTASMEQKETLKMEDKLEQALLAENQSSENETDGQEQESESLQESGDVQESEALQESEDAQESEALQESEDARESEALQESEDAQGTEALQESETASANPELPKNRLEPVAYIIQPGDTLIGICIRQYGSDVRIADVCSLNNISDPNDIKKGQIILLPN